MAGAHDAHNLPVAGVLKSLIVNKALVCNELHAANKLQALDWVKVYLKLTEFLGNVKFRVELWGAFLNFRGEIHLGLTEEVESELEVSVDVQKKESGSEDDLEYETPDEHKPEHP